MKFEQFRRLCLSLPEAEEIETWGESTFRVHGRIFAMGSPEGKSVSVKATLDALDGRILQQPGHEVAANKSGAAADKYFHSFRS